VFLGKGVEIKPGDQARETEGDQCPDPGQGIDHDPQETNQGQDPQEGGGVSLQGDPEAGEGDFPDHAAEADQMTMDTDFILEIWTRIAESQIWRRFS